MADWSYLPQDLVISIAKRQLVALEDFVTFGAVCKSWHLAATAASKYCTGQLTHQVPFLMFPPDKDCDTRKFYSLTRCKIYQLDLPEAKWKKGKLCYYSSGWLITTQFDPQHSTFYLNLLHPLNYHDQIKLPNFDLWTSDSMKFVLSSSPSWSSSYIVMVRFAPRGFAFCRPYDEHWRRCYSREDTSDVTYYQGQFYALGVNGSVLICDIECPKIALTRRIVPNMPEELVPSTFKSLYLVEVAGELFVVFLCRRESDDLPASVIGFRVFRVPFSNGNWQSDLEVKNLGNKTLFLCEDSSFSVESSNYSGCKPNCIYFLLYKDHIHWYNDGKVERTRTTYMGIFNMEDKKIEFPSLVFGYLASSIERFKWIQPSLKPNLRFVFQ